jgi:hypothetical protein
LYEDLKAENSEQEPNYKPYYIKYETDKFRFQANLLGLSSLTLKINLVPDEYLNIRLKSDGLAFPITPNTPYFITNIKYKIIIIITELSKL